MTRRLEGRYRTKAVPKYIVVVEDGGDTADGIRNFYDGPEVFETMKAHVEAAVHNSDSRAHVFERTTEVSRPGNTIWDGALGGKFK